MRSRARAPRRGTARGSIARIERTTTSESPGGSLRRIERRGSRPPRAGGILRCVPRARRALRVAALQLPPPAHLPRRGRGGDRAGRIRARVAEAGELRRAVELLDVALHARSAPGSDARTIRPELD